MKPDSWCREELAITSMRTNLCIVLFGLRAEWPHDENETDLGMEIRKQRHEACSCEVLDPASNVGTSVWKAQASPASQALWVWVKHIRKQSA